MRRIEDDRIANHDARELITNRAPPAGPTPEREPVQLRDGEHHEECGKHGLWLMAEQSQ
jgi:hypothetical protein